MTTYSLAATVNAGTGDADDVHRQHAGGISKYYEQLNVPPGTKIGFRHFIPTSPAPVASDPTDNPFNGSLQEAALAMENDTRGEGNERWREGRQRRVPNGFIDTWGGKAAIGAGLAGAALGIPGAGLVVGLHDLAARRLNRDHYNRMGEPYGVTYDGPVLKPFDNPLNSRASANRHFNQAISTPAAHQNYYEFEAYPNGRKTWSASVPKRAKTVERENSGDRSSPRGGGRGGVDYDKLGRVESRPNYGGPR